MFGTNLDAMANLNQFEANTWGEVDIGLAVQFGLVDFTFVYDDVWMQICTLELLHLFSHV
jgi:hypothetical protein